MLQADESTISLKKKTRTTQSELEKAHGASQVSPAAILIVLVMASVAAPLSLNKVSPIAPTLMQIFNIGEAQLGMLISVFSLTGIILALPGGLLIHRFGPWKCMLTALFALLSGSLIGTFAESFSLLLFSRVIEGIGMALIAIAGPAIIGSTVSSRRRGLAMGMFSAYIGVGQVLTYNLAPRIIKASGWQGVWWFATIYITAMIVIWIALMLKTKTFISRKDSQPDSDRLADDDAKAANVSALPTVSLASILKSKSLWLLTGSMAIYIITYASVQTFLPSYLSAMRNMNMASASSLVSVCCFTGTCFSLVAGIISDKLNSRRLLGGFCLFGSAVLFAVLPWIPTSAYLPMMFILGTIPPVIPVCIFAASSEVIDNPAKGGLAMGLISMGQNIGFTAGPIMFGAIAQIAGWSMAFYATAPIAVIGGFFMLMNKKVRESESV